MRRSTAAVFAVAALFIGAGYFATAEGRAEGRGYRAETGPAVGDLVLDVQFRDVQKRRGRLSELRQAGAVVVVAWNGECDVANQYVETMGRLEKEFAGRGVDVVYLNLKATGAVKEMKEQVEALGLAGYWVRDPEWKAARLLQPTSAPEAFVIDAAGTLRYRGAIDEQFDGAISRAAPGRDFLRDAVHAVLDGRPVATSRTEAPGCAATPPDGATPAVIPVTYHNRISRILQQACEGCGAESPLSSHEGVRAVAPSLLQQLPSTASGDVGATIVLANLSFADGATLTLSPRDVRDLRGWIEAGMPEGRRRDAPLPR
jgi:hypothetical protein